MYNGYYRTWVLQSVVLALLSIFIVLDCPLLIGQSISEQGGSLSTQALPEHVQPCSTDGINSTRPELHFPFLRFDEDWSFLRCGDGSHDRWDRLKFIPLHGDGSAYLSLGGDAREVYEVYDYQYWGDGPQDRGGWVDQHFLGHADLHLGAHFRIFGELQSAFENGRHGGPRPYDNDKLDIHQAFADYAPSEGGDKFLLRVGRQELYFGSGRLVDARFGLNTRISFDGFRMTTKIHRMKVDGFTTRPTLQRPGYFDDTPDSQKMFWGIYGTTPLTRSANLDVYYLGFNSKHQTFAKGSGQLMLHTLGGRLFGQSRNLDFDNEINAQVGLFGNGDVRAWSVSLSHGYTFSSRRASPRLSLHSDVTSGDNGTHDRLGTFFPLYAKGKYFGEADLNGPSNTIDLIPQIDLHLHSGITLSTSYGAFWRESTHDGIYGFAGNLYKTGGNGNARLIGQQAEVDMNFLVAPHTMVRAVYEHFFSGPFLQQNPPGHNVNYATVWFDYHF
ncbi:MAG TPA: alginate export family protein [Acidobacteriaceae bacterium]|jgi:hypothetical protein